LCHTGCKIALVDVSAPASRRRSRFFFRAEDLVWLILFAGLAVFNTEKNYPALIILVAMAVFQVAEPKVRALSSHKGAIAASAIKLILAYLLVGFSDTFESHYFLILFVPVISAATSLELLGTFVFIVLACAAYLSFLLSVDWNKYELTAGAFDTLCLRCIFVGVVGFLVYQQAKAKRQEMLRTEEAGRNLRRAEASLRRSERLAALGQLTAGLAHELRNPLGTIKASAEFMTKPATQAKPEVMGEMAANVASEVDRTNALISRFLDFAKPLEIHAQLSDLLPVIDNVVRQLAEVARTHDVDIRKETPPGPLEFLFDPDLLPLALQNLVQNAIQASRPGQTVTVRVHPSVGQVLIQVLDQGSGIDAQHLESVFNPFFTTKPNGVGLGLALVSKIVDEHGGKIAVHSEKGKGTSFDVSIPRDTEVAPTSV
jgi:two-component system, NtrC family, sensor histidine kinase HydH